MNATDAPHREVSLGAKLREVAELMATNQFHDVQVTDHGHAVGVVTPRDLLRAVGQFHGNVGASTICRVMSRPLDHKRLEE